MTIHKLANERAAERADRAVTSPGINVSMHQPMGYHVAHAMVRARAVQGCDFDLYRLPVHRTLRWSVQRKVADFFDDMALDGGFESQRVHEGTVLLHAPGAFVYCNGYSKGSYTSCNFSLWAESRARADEVVARLEQIAGAARMSNESFTLEWQFTNSAGELRRTSFQELGDPDLLDEAYPSLGLPVREFLERYLDAVECVLILLGPPGTGKTRLVRALKTDEIFVEFITGSHDAFVIEDSDHLLAARTNGNQDMHRFLATADGVARSQGRKVIFTTNLPNVNDIDEALTRPGRCFAVKHLRNLTLEEAQRLATRLCSADEARAEKVRQELSAIAARSYSVAQVYRMSGGDGARACIPA